MLTMNAHRLILVLFLCFLCESSNVSIESGCLIMIDEQHFQQSCEDSDFCETNTLRVPLGSSVLLPCYFSAKSLDWVFWVHTPVMDLVHLTSSGRLEFMDPRNGRVKAFPNQGSEGNYSICISELKTSDLGCYQCKQGTDCVQVEVHAETDYWSKDREEIKETGEIEEETLLLILISVGGACLLLIVCLFFCMKYLVCCNNTTQNNGSNLGGAENEDKVRINQQSSPIGILDRTLPPESTSGVHPNLNRFNFEKMESLRQKPMFQKELISRLRQTSVLQQTTRAEIIRHQAESHHRDFKEVGSPR